MPGTRPTGASQLYTSCTHISPLYTTCSCMCTLPLSYLTTPGIPLPFFSRPPPASASQSHSVRLLSFAVLTTLTPTIPDPSFQVHNLSTPPRSSIPDQSLQVHSTSQSFRFGLIIVFFKQIIENISSCNSFWYIDLRGDRRTLR